MTDLAITVRTFRKHEWQVHTAVNGKTILREFRSFHEAQTYAKGVQDCFVAWQVAAAETEQ